MAAAGLTAVAALSTVVEHAPMRVMQALHIVMAAAKATAVVGTAAVADRATAVVLDTVAVDTAAGTAKRRL